MIVLLLGLNVLSEAAEPQVELRITAKKCFQGVAGAPPGLWIVVFDASKVSDLIRQKREFDLNSNPVDGAGADKMFEIYNDLYRRVKTTTPALYRSRQPLPGARVNAISVPFAKRYIVFGLGNDESEVTSIASREIEPQVGKPGSVVLYFSSETECIKR